MNVFSARLPNCLWPRLLAPTEKAKRRIIECFIAQINNNWPKYGRSLWTIPVKGASVVPRTPSRHHDARIVRPDRSLIKPEGVFFLRLPG